MPNWCFNTLTIQGPKSEIDYIKDKLNAPFSVLHDSWNRETGEMEVKETNYSAPVFAFWNIHSPIEEGITMEEYVQQPSRLGISVNDPNWFVKEIEHAKTQKDWYKYWNLQKRPDDIPYDPAQIYKKEGWKGWKDFLKREFISFEDILPTNKAWVCHFPYKDKKTEMLNVTNCTALGYGWAWQISLWNRMGTGYVFSDKFTTKEDALIEFKNYLSTVDPERAKLVEPRLIDIRHGVRKKAWAGNVVGVGLSYGFIEPLESTGLLTTHETIIRLVESLNRRDGWITRTEREIFNYSSELNISRALS